MLVRRRSGDDDTRWQVKLPAAQGRTELRWPLTDSPPKSLPNLLIGVGLAKSLDKVATVPFDYLGALRLLHRLAAKDGTGTAVALEISTGDGRSTVDAPTDPSASRTVTIRSSSGDVSYLGAE